jgi:uncharacterized protein YjhX (UPF0386 family)
MSKYFPEMTTLPREIANFWCFTPDSLTTQGVFLIIFRKLQSENFVCGECF